MSLQDFLTDALNLLLGKDDSEEKEDFKKAISDSIKDNKIDLAAANELMETRNNVNKEAEEFDKRQMATISLEDGIKVSVKDAKKKKEELARKKENEEKIRRISSENINKNNEKIKSVSKNNTKLKVDRQKLQNEILKEEQKESMNKNISEREGKN